MPPKKPADTPCQRAAGLKQSLFSDWRLGRSRVSALLRLRLLHEEAAIKPQCPVERSTGQAAALAAAAATETAVVAAEAAAEAAADAADAAGAAQAASDTFESVMLARGWQRAAADISNVPGVQAPHVRVVGRGGARRGDTRVPLDGPAIPVGSQVCIGAGTAGAEINVAIGTGSVLLASALLNDHGGGAVIRVAGTGGSGLFASSALDWVSAEWTLTDLPLQAIYSSSDPSLLVWRAPSMLPAAAAGFGWQLQPCHLKTGSYAAEVISVEEGSVAWGAGIALGDIIVTAGLKTPPFLIG
jgi:hypothetical protein